MVKGEKSLWELWDHHVASFHDDIVSLQGLQNQQNSQLLSALKQLMDENDTGFRELIKINYQDQTATIEAIEQIVRDSDAHYAEMMETQRQEHSAIVALIQENETKNRGATIEVIKQIEQIVRDNTHYAEMIERQRKEHNAAVAMIQQNQSALMKVQQQISALFQLQSDLKTMIFTVVSYVQNQFIPKQDLSMNDRYQYLHKLHLLLEPKELESHLNKIRVGRHNDCGYVMVTPLSEQKIAYSIGIATEVSWDKDMASYGYQIYQYDHTIQALPEENENFHWHQIGLGKADNDNVKTLKSVLEENGHTKSHGMILKMDIEGAEWDVINACSTDILDAFDQIVLELHDLTISSKKSEIISALEKLNSTHFIAHIHGNNYSFVDFCYNMVTPNVLEITCLNRRKYHFTGRLKAALPLGIDDPNRPDAPDIPLVNW